MDSMEMKHLSMWNATYFFEEGIHLGPGETQQHCPIALFMLWVTKAYYFPSMKSSWPASWWDTWCAFGEVVTFSYEQLLKVSMSHVVGCKLLTFGDLLCCLVRDLLTILSWPLCNCWSSRNRLLFIDFQICTARLNMIEAIQVPISWTRCPTPVTTAEKKTQSLLIIQQMLTTQTMLYSEV